MLKTWTERRQAFDSNCDTSADEAGVLLRVAAAEVLGLTAPPTLKAIDLLETIGVLRETTGQQRDRVDAYHEYLRILTGDKA